MYLVPSILCSSCRTTAQLSYGIGGKSCNRTPAALESCAESDGSQAARSGNLCTYAVDEKSCNRALDADRRGVRRRDARGAQRLRKAIRGGPARPRKRRYAARVADGAQRLRYGGIDDQSNNPGTSNCLKGEIVSTRVFSRFLCSRKSCLGSNFRYTPEKGSAL